VVKGSLQSDVLVIMERKEPVVVKKSSPQIGTKRGRERGRKDRKKETV
jgi:hypothetical protein